MRSRVKKRQTPPGDDAGRPKTRAELVAEKAALRDQLAALETSRADAPPTAGNPQGAAEPASTDRARQLEAVRTVSEEITRELNLSSLLNLILQRAVDLVGAVGGTILFWDATEQVLVPQVHSELFGTLEWRQIPAGVGVVGRVAATRTGLRINDYRAWSGALTTALARTGVTASMAEPLLYRDALVGVINTVHTDGRATFSEHDADTLRLFANQAAIAIENARLYEAAGRELHERQQAESRLRQRESQYRRIVETATEGIWALDADNRTTFTNRKMADMLGYATQEMLGRPLFDFIAEEERPKSAAAMERRRQGVAEQIERSFVRKDGTRLVALVNTSPIYDETGQFAGSFGMLTDITGRRQAEQALAARTRQLDALRLVSEEITRELDLDMLLGLITRRAVELVAGMGGGVYLWDETAQQIMPHAYHGTAESQGRFPRRLGEGLIGHVARTRQGMIVNDYRAAPFAHPRTLDTTNISAVLAEPFSYGDRFLGVIAVHHDGGAREFTAQDQETLRLFANQAAIAIENARLYEAAQREIHERQQAQSILRARTQQIEAVRAVGEEITRELDLTRLLDLVVRRAVDLVGAAGGSLYLWDEADQALIPSAWSRHGNWLPQARMGYNQGLGGTVAARREGMIVNDYRNWPSASPLVLERSRITAAVAEPLLSRDRLLGVIILDAQEGERRFNEEDQRILSLLATQAAIAIENARLFASAQHELAERARAEAALTARTRQLEAARRTTIDITRELHVSALLDLLVERAVDLIAVRSGTLFLWDDAAEALVSQVTSGLGEWFSGVRLALGEGVAGAVAQQRMGLIVNDYRSSPHTIPWFVERTDVTAVLGEPLLYRDRLVGVILLRDRRDRQPFTADDQGLLRLFAAQAAIAIENARLHENTSRRAQQLATLVGLARILTTELDLQRVSQRILEAAETLIPGSTGRLWERIVDGRLLRVIGSRGLAHPERGQDFLLVPGEGLLGIAEATRQPAVSADVTHDPRFKDAAWATAEGLVACIILPMERGEKIIGFLTLYTRVPHEFIRDEVDVLRTFAAQAAIAIENAQLYEATRRRAEHFATLNDIARALTTTLDPQRVAEQALRAVHVLLPEAAARFWVHGPEEGVFRHVAGVGVRDRSAEDAVRFVPGEGLLGLTLTTRRPVISRDVTTDPRYREKDRARAQGLTSCAMLPLLAADRVSGVLAIFTRTVHDFSEEELALLSAFAAHVAIALENARLFADLRRAYQEVQRAQDELIRSEKLRALGQMAAGMAHDLNNVLAAVLGQAELLRLRIPDPAIHESLSTLVTAATDGAQIVRRLQDFARQQPGRPPAAVDLASAVREALEITSSRWKDEPQQRGLLIRVETALDSLPPVLGHAAEIREALTNLIINAVDAMPQGGTLAVQGQLVESSRSPAVDSSKGQPDGSVLPSPQSTNEPIDPSTSWVELTVTDTGVGMAEDVRRRIFDPFFTTKGVKGSGLGLSVVYGIMQRHQGSIDVVSAPGRGTTFVLRFQAAPTADTLPQSVRGRQSFPPRRLLLIDDESTVRQTLSALLRAAGHQVSEYDEGTKGLAHLGEHSVDLVVTDLGMPEMSGWDVTRAVKAAHPRLPVILLTGWGEHPASQADHPSLVDRILGKPVRLDELLVAIDQLTAPGDRGPDASATAPASS